MRRALLRFLRATRLIALADKAVALRAAYAARKANDGYRRAHPDRAFPDPTLVYEVAGHPYIEQFDRTGAAHAALIASLLRDAGLPASPRALEWGCGPARIIGHLPAALSDAGARFHGCDPDPRAIAFARRAHPGVTFERSAFTPPAPYSDQAFDAIYGVSIFTHLDETSARAWAGELARLAAPEGCVLVTSHGARAAANLADRDREAFDAGAYVALGGAPMGSRTYVSYFNEASGRRLFEPHFADVSLRADAPGGLGQDIWLLRRPRRA